MAKCPICNINKSNKKDLLEHVEDAHKNDIPQGMSAAQYIYSLNHDGRTHGLCRICGNPTPWNEKTGKPKQICGSKSCKERVSKEFEANLKSKLNMTRQDLMNNPDHQEQMLANRKISGVYKWSDGKHSFTYTGTYEKFALEWLDKVMDIDPDTIQTPGPKIQYMFEGKPHYWITDMYLTDYNLVIEVKDGSGTGEKNTHPGFAHNRALEKAKDDYMKTQKQYNYLKLTNKNMMQLVKILSEIRLNNIFSTDRGTKKEEPFININESVETLLTTNPFKNKITLYHGSHNLEKLNTIKPVSRNAGTKLSKPRYSSFWSDNKNFAIEFAIFKLISNDFLIYYNSNNKWLIRKCDRQNIINSLRNKHIWIYTKTFSKSELGIGHEQSENLSEFSIDTNVIPDKSEKINFNEFKFILDQKFLPILPDDIDKAKNIGKKAALSSNNQSKNVMKNLIYHDLNTTMDILKNMEKVNPDILDESVRLNDKKEPVPNKCPKCGSKISIFFKGEPVYACTNNKCGKTFGVVPFSESIDHISLISNDEIESLCEGTYVYNEPQEIELLTEAWFPFFLSNNKIDKLSDESYKKNSVKMPDNAFSTYDIKEDTWKKILFPKNDFTKKITSVFHKVEINDKNHTIEIRGINYGKLIQHIKDLYPDQKVYKIFEIIYNSKDWDRYQNKRIPKKYVRVEYIQTYEFFALELSILFKELYEKYNLSYYNDICVELYNKTWLSNSDIIKPDSIDINALRFLNENYELKIYQKEFIESYPTLKARLNLNGYILSFDQGLGKTLTAIALSLCLKKQKVYIVCPNALKENWALEIKLYFDKYKNEDLWKEDVYIQGISNSFDPKKAKFIIVNQESISKIFDKVDKNTNNMLVIDESHNFRNINSNRSSDLIKLKDMLNTKDTLVMSGTPIKASPSEICPVLRLIDPLFTNEVAMVYNKCFNMNDIAASNLIQTRFGKIMYRKTKAEVLQLPEKKIDALKLKVSNPDKYIVKNVRYLVKDRAKELYKTEYKDYDSMQQEFHDLINKYSKSSKEDINKYLKIIDDNIPNYELHEMDVTFKNNYLEKYVNPYITGTDKERLEYLLVRFVNMWQHCIGIALGEIMHPRRKELFIKLFEENKGIITNMIFDNVKKTVIFTPLVDVANYIHKSLEDAGLSSVLVTGQVKDKLTPILRFKEDSKVDVLVATSQTLGTGVTLTEANLMLFFGTPWRSADFDQCCDRIYRIGQTSDVFIFKVLMDSEELNLSTRMETILNWSNQMFGAMITSTEDQNIEGLNESTYTDKSDGELRLLANQYMNLKNRNIRINMDAYYALMDECEKRGIKPDGSQYYPNKNSRKAKNESVMSISNLSPILTNGFYEELNSNETNEDFDEQLEALKKSLNESLDESINPKDYCPETLTDKDTPDSQLMNRVKSDIVNNSIIDVHVNQHSGTLYATSDFHIFGVWDKNDNNNNATNIQQVNRIIDDINSKVKENDTLIICGDLGYKLDDCLYQHTKYFLSAIKCKHIWLVVGNHDLLTNDQYKELGCEIVCDRLIYNGWIFTHYPTKGYNIHGHLHTEEIDGKYDDVDSNNKWNVFYYTHGIVNVKEDIIDVVRSEEDDDLLTEEAIYDNEHKYPIFITLMHTGSSLANIIKKFTHDEYTHAAISLTSDLNPLYSFCRKKIDVKGGMGFSLTDPSDETFKRLKSIYSVYVMYLSKNEYDNLNKRLEFFLSNQDNLKYDFIGLVLIAMNIPSEFRKKYFCSRFVADVINAGRKMDKLPSLYKPNDLAYLTDITLVNKGLDFSKYDKRITDRNLELVKQGKYDQITLSEVSLKDSDVVFGNGEYSAITDNRFTDFQTGIENNEDIDPYTAMFSPNNSKPVQDYMDASNNFETNEDVRVDMETDPDSCNPNDLSSIAQSIYDSNFN